MDGLRKRLIVNYNSLTKKLNRNIIDGDEIRISPEDIQDEMEGIRNGLVTLSFCYLDGPNGFSELDENTHFEDFYPEDLEN